MNIASTQYSVNTQSFDIYVSGCNPPHCKDCHNPLLFDFNVGTDYFKIQQSMFKKIKEFDSLIKNIFIYGGEPLDQDRIYSMLVDLCYFKLPIWLFTKYELNLIPSHIKEICSYIKTGRYDNTLLSDDHYSFGIKLASTNQIINEMKK